MKASLDLTDNRVLITGASGGIGIALVESYLEQGASVLASDIAESDAMLKLVNLYPDQLVFRQVDLMDVDSLEALLAEAYDSNINTLINNAALFDMAPLWESDLEQYDRLFSINVRAMFRLMQGICSDLRAKKQKGKVVNFSSQAGRRGEALVAHYCASKAAVISYTQSAALAFAPYDITVNAIAPGVIDTPMWEEVDRLFATYEDRPLGEKKRLVGEQVPLGRMGNPQDLVGAVLFLTSTLADYITGQTLNVDGGSVLS